jgi:hypothetical protein
MKKTYYYKDYCRIYWRIEFEENQSAQHWDIKIMRSLDEHDDPEAQEAFHCSQDLNKEPDPIKAIKQMRAYYKIVTTDMLDHILTLYEPKIE